mmetsp:Transcript_42719/g.90828  ORF Transcript_42719/g.90828 Transcript_42719/m.90828 type:complete len:357 (-) Transcript_42719:1862-2932(-)
MKSFSFIFRSERIFSLCRSVLSMMMLNERRYAASLALFSSVENTFNNVDSTHCGDMLSANACRMRSIICASPGSRNVARNMRSPSSTVRFWNAKEEQKDVSSSLWNQSRSKAGVASLASFSDFPTSPRYSPTLAFSKPTTSPFLRNDAMPRGVGGEGSKPLSTRNCRPFLGFSLNSLAAWCRLCFLSLDARRREAVGAPSFKTREGSPSVSVPWNRRRRLPNRASKDSSFRRSGTERWRATSIGGAPLESGLLEWTGVGAPLVAPLMLDDALLNPVGVGKYGSPSSSTTPPQHRLSSTSSPDATSDSVMEQSYVRNSSSMVLNDLPPPPLSLLRHRTSTRLSKITSASASNAIFAS